MIRSGLEERVARIEGILEQMDKRFKDVLGQLNERLNHLESEIRDLRRDLNYRFYWLLGVQISMWITIIIAVLLK
jgi:hypothetical protein